MKYAKEDLARLHEELYRTLAEVVRVCEVCDIPYFIQGGSAIGALYNKGIVPWDDDIDVGMTRENYERFLREAPAHLSPDYFLEWFGTEENTLSTSQRLSATTPSLSRRFGVIWRYITAFLSMFFHTIAFPTTHSWRNCIAFRQSFG